MKFTILQEVLLQPISQVIGVVERRQTLPVLANFLVSARGKRLSITGTDMEVELIASVNADIQTEGEITVPARKLVDITRRTGIRMDSRRGLRFSGSGVCLFP